MKTNGLGGVSKRVVPARESQNDDEKTRLGRGKRRGGPCICAGWGGVNEGVVPKSKTLKENPKSLNPKTEGVVPASSQVGEG